MEGLDRVEIPLESPKLALFERKGGFLFSERWLAQNGTVAFFERTTHAPPAFRSSLLATRHAPSSAGRQVGEVI